MVESLNEACGVFGIYNNPLAAQLTYLGLYALQHRGQESSGIAVADGTSVSVHKGMGLVNQVFKHKKYWTISKVSQPSDITVIQPPDHQQSKMHNQFLSTVVQVLLQEHTMVI